MRWVSYTRAISSRIGEENPANTISEQNTHIEQYLKDKGYSISEKYSDRKKSAEATEGFDRLVQDGMSGKFDAVAVDSIFRFGRTLAFAVEVLQKTFYPLGIQFAVVEDDFFSLGKTEKSVEQYFREKVNEKARFELITNRKNSFENGLLTYRQVKYGYALSEDRRKIVPDSESAPVVKLIFQMYLEEMNLREIAAALDAQNVPSPQIQMVRNKKSTRKTEWQSSTIRSILTNPVYIGQFTLKLAGAERKMEVPPILSRGDFQKVQEKINASVKISGRQKRETPNLLIRKVYDRASGERLLCRTSEDEIQQVYSFDRGYKCFTGKVPCIASTEIFDAILSKLKLAKEQASRIDKRIDSDQNEVEEYQKAALRPYRERAKMLVNALSEKDMERTAVYQQYESCKIEKERLEEYEIQYKAEIKQLEVEFKIIMERVSEVEKAFSHGNPWLIKFRDITIPATLERIHIKKYVERVWIEEFKSVDVVLKEDEWKNLLPIEWIESGKEN